MTTSEHERADEPRTPQGSGSLALPIAMLIVAMILGAASLTVVVFGAWPAVILVLLSAGLAAYALSRIRRHDASARP